MDIIEIAKVCHGVNRGLCIALGDFSQRSWADAPEWQRESAISGVEAVKGGLDQPAASHSNWVVEKRGAGWVYGEVKDEEAKTHPCMVSFTALPIEQQLKDHLFVTTAKVLLDGQ